MWHKRLAPMRRYPGRRARVLSELKTSELAQNRKRKIDEAMQKANPRERWEINTRREETGTYGVWVTYHGVMTEAEYLKDCVARQAKKDVHAARVLAKQARTAGRVVGLRPSAYNPRLRPPRVDLD